MHCRSCTQKVLEMYTLCTACIRSIENYWHMGCVVCGIKSIFTECRQVLLMQYVTALYLFYWTIVNSRCHSQACGFTDDIPAREKNTELISGRKIIIIMMTSSILTNHFCTPWVCEEHKQEGYCKLLLVAAVVNTSETLFHGHVAVSLCCGNRG